MTATFNYLDISYRVEFLYQPVPVAFWHRGRKVSAERLQTLAILSTVSGRVATGNATHNGGDLFSFRAGRLKAMRSLTWQLPPTLRESPLLVATMWRAYLDGEAQLQRLELGTVTASR